MTIADKPQTIADKLQTITDNMQMVFDAGYLEGQEASGYNEGVEAGKKEEYDLFWDTAQEYGNRENYNFAFSADIWSQDTFRPKYPLKPKRAQNMFAYWGYNSTLATAKKIDLSHIDFDFSAAVELGSVFYANRCITALGCIDVRGVAANLMHNMFASTLNLVTIKELKISETTGFYATTFSSANSLKNITINGRITSSIDLHWSTKLSRESIESIFWASMSDGGSASHTVTLSHTAVNKAYETTEGANDGSNSDEFMSWVNNATFTISLV